MPSKPWGCRSKTLTPTPEPAGYCAGDVAGERGDGAARLRGLHRRHERVRHGEAMLTKMSSSATRKSNWMPPRHLCWTSAGSTGEPMPFGSSGESGSPPGRPSDSSTSWSMPGTASSCCSTCGCAVAPRASRCPSGRCAWVYTFRDGLIVHMKLYMSQSEALEAVGLSEQDAHADS